MTGIAGFLMIFAVILLLLKNKMAPFVVLTVLPVPVRRPSAMLIGRCLTPFVCPLVPAVHLGMSMAKIELKEHLKFSIPVYWVASALFLFFGLLMGIV